MFSGFLDWVKTNFWISTRCPKNMRHKDLYSVTLITQASIQLLNWNQDYSKAEIRISILGAKLILRNIGEPRDPKPKFGFILEIINKKKSIILL